MISRNRIRLTISVRNSSICPKDPDECSYSIYHMPRTVEHYSVHRLFLGGIDNETTYQVDSNRLRYTAVLLQWRFTGADDYRRCEWNRDRSDGSRRCQRK